MEVPSHGDETILMVEDDELVRMSVQSLIESLGFRVVPASKLSADERAFLDRIRSLISPR